MATNNQSWLAWGIPLIVIGSLILLIFVIWLIVRIVLRGPMYKGQAEEMTGKTVLITGGNTGIGKETARDLARRGAKVIILCRNVDKGSAAAKEISEETGTSVGIQKLDLSSFESIRECAALIKEQEPKVHVLINNAGMAVCPEWKTQDGLEMQIGTNHFGHFLLTLLLLDNIKAAAPSRIIVLSSLAHKLGTGKMNWDDLHLKNNYNANDAYNQSKLANLLFSNALAKKLEGSGVTTYAVHPGFVKTNLGQHTGSVYGKCISRMMMTMVNSVSKDPSQGAQTSIACAVDKRLGEETGKYYIDCKEATPSKEGRNMEDAEKLWEISLDTVDLKNFEV